MAEELSEAVRADRYQVFADFVFGLKGNDSAQATAFLRGVIAHLPSSSDGLHKRQAGDTASHTSKLRRTDDLGDMDYLKYDDWVDHDNTVCLVMPNNSSLLSTIIGKSGAVISELERESQCKIVVEKESGHAHQMERKILLTGTLKACNLAQHFISQISNESSPIGGNSMRISVPNNSVRYLIGKGGCVIQRLEKESGASIKIESEQEMDPMIGGRRVTLTGSGRACTIAQYLISHMLGDPHIKSRAGDSVPTPSFQQQPVFTIRQSQPFQPPPQHQQSQMQPLQSQPLPTQFWQGSPQQYLPVDMGAYGSGVMSGMNSEMGGYGSGGLPTLGGPPVLGGGTAGGGAQTTVEVLIPNPSVGNIIGKQGSSIGQVQQQSGCTIKVAKVEEMPHGDPNRKVTLIGTHDQCAHAQSLLEQKVQQWRQFEESRQ